MNISIELAIRSIIAEEVAAAMRQVREELAVQADRTLTFVEACGYANINENIMRRLIRQKRIPHRVVGAEGSQKPRYFFSSRSLDQWMRDQEAANYQREVK